MNQPAAHSSGSAAVTTAERPTPRAQAGGYGSEPGPYVLAHRGGAALGPENTLPTFERSLALGVRYLETDVRVTSDGVALAFHDQTLDRVTKARGPLARYTWAQLRGLDIRGPQGEKAPIVTLADALGSFPDARFTVDLKSPRSIGPTIEAVRRTRSADRVCVAGGWDSWLRAVADGAGTQQALGWRALTALLTAAKLGRRVHPSVATGGYAHVAWHLGHAVLGASLAEHPRVCGRLVEMAHELGIKVNVWTVNDRYSMNRLLDQGVDGIFTDRPDRARELLIRRGEWAPMWGTAAP